jgi:hypothetical protein
VGILKLKDAAPASKLAKKKNRKDGGTAMCVESISFLNEGKLDGAAGALVL